MLKKLRVLTGEDVPNPEDMAMLMALYSRSPASVDDHLEKIVAAGSSKFMSTFYVGYGHESIGNCGDLSIFMEGISMLAAKAIQDNALYNGQEASTRYMDFSKAVFLTANDTDKEVELIEKWRPLYLRALDVLPVYLREVYPPEFVLPRVDANDVAAGRSRDSMYEKTLKAIVFDVARGLLPCGATTNVAWKGILSNVNRHSIYLSEHPLDEVKKLAKDIYKAASAKAPNSFKLTMPTLPEYLKKVSNYYINAGGFKPEPEVALCIRHGLSLVEAMKEVSYFCADSSRDNARIKAHMPWPEGVENIAQFEIKGLLDFASYRDLQRHRPGHHPVPVVGAHYGMHNWYMKQYLAADPQLASDIEELFDEVTFFWKHTHQISAQYLFPMMTVVPIYLEWPLEQLVYVTELRTGVSVHPTLRAFMHSTYKAANALFPVLAGIPSEDTVLPNGPAIVHPDYRKDYENSRRGDQDIVQLSK